MKLTILTEDRYHEYESFISERADSTVFHTLRWKRFLDDNNVKNYYFIAMNQAEEIIGVFPLICSHASPKLRGLISEHYYMPLFCDSASFRMAFHRLIELLPRTGYQYIDVTLPITSPLAKHLLEVCRGPYINYCNFLLELSDNPDHIFKFKLNKKIRNSIKKAIKKGVVVEFKLPCNEVYRRLCIDTAIRQARAPENLKVAVFASERFQWKKDFIALTASYEGKTIAFLLALLYRGRDAYVTTNYSLSSFLWLCPNELLYWRLIEFLCEGGYKHLWFGVTPMRQTHGLHLFKRRFGGSLIPLLNYQFYVKTLPRLRLSLNRWFYGFSCMELRRHALINKIVANIKSLFH